MTAGTDVLQPVHYRRDQWNIDRLPQALLVCFIGLAFLVYGDPPRPGQLWFIVPVFVAVLVVAAAVMLLGFYATHSVSAAKGIGAGIVAAVLAIIGIFSTGGSHSRSIQPGSGGAALFGWFMIVIGVGWLAAVIFRHFVPARPWLAFSREGIAYRHGGGTKMVIPWHEVHAVDGRFCLEAPHHLDVTTVLISKAFYDRAILPNYTVFNGLGWDSTFRPNDTMMQVALHHQPFRVEPKDIREPLEARWIAFRNRPKSSVPSVPVEAPAAATPLVYGCWSGGLTQWQTVKFALPTIGLLAVATNAAGLWDVAALKSIREHRAATLKRYEDAAAEQNRYREIMKRSNEAAAERERKSRESEREMDRIFSR